MKKLPIGMEFFSDFILNECYYVDKTFLLKTVFQEDPSPVTLITRPRRFGKTLTMSTFCEFLKLNPDNPEDKSVQRELFANTQIYTDQDFCNHHMGRFPVIFLTLKDVTGDTLELAVEQLAKTVVQLIKRDFSYLLTSPKLAPDERQLLLKISDYSYFSKGWFRTSPDEQQYHIEKNIDSQDHIRENLQNSLLFLSGCLNRHHNIKPILLIDEYDVPIAYAAQHGYYEQFMPIISSFLGKVLKTNHVLRKAVLTGCLRAAKESIFTGLNNLNINTVLTRASPELSRGQGFTGQETEQILSYYGMDKYAGMVKEHYDGYMFGREHIYCPWDVISFINDNRLNLEEYEDEIFADNYWVNTSSNAAIEDFMNYITSDDIEQMQSLMDGHSISSVIRTSLCYGDLQNHQISDFWTLLLYTGYLTYDPKSLKPYDKSGGRYIANLYIPNQEIRTCFNERILSYFENNRDYRNRIINTIRGLFNGDAVSVESNLNGLLEKYISIRDLATRAPKENYYHGFMNGILINGASIIKEQSSNMESGNGYVDLLVKSKNGDSVVILELKQTADKDQSKKILAQAAVKQIIERKYADRYESNPDIVKIYACGICFCKKVCSVVIEQLK